MESNHKKLGNIISREARADVPSIQVPDTARDRISPPVCHTPSTPLSKTLISGHWILEDDGYHE